MGFRISKTQTWLYLGGAVLLLLQSLLFPIMATIAPDYWKKLMLPVTIEITRSMANPSTGEIRIANTMASTKTIIRPMVTLIAGVPIRRIEVFSKPGRLLCVAVDSDFVRIPAGLHIGHDLLIRFLTDGPYELQNVLINGTDFAASLKYNQETKDFKSNLLIGSLFGIGLSLLIGEAVFFLEVSKKMRQYSSAVNQQKEKFRAFFNQNGNSEHDSLKDFLNHLFGNEE